MSIRDFPQNDNLFREGPSPGSHGTKRRESQSCLSRGRSQIFWVPVDGVPEAYLLNLLGFGQLSLGFVGFFLLG